MTSPQGLPALDAGNEGLLAVVEMSCWRAHTPEQVGEKKGALAFVGALEHIGSLCGVIGA